MAFYSPTNGDRYSRHVYDIALALDEIEQGRADDLVTQDLLDGYDPMWSMLALETLGKLRSAVESEIIRSISDARIDSDNGHGMDDEFELSPPTWAEIGRRLDVSAQAAQQRYGSRLKGHSLEGTGDSAGLAVPHTHALAPSHATQRGVKAVL